jgi:hypothetical protein
VGVEGRSPFAEGVDGFAVEHEVARQQPQGEAGSETQTPVVVRDEAFEELGEVEPLEEVVGRREGPRIWVSRENRPDPGTTRSVTWPWLLGPYIY